MVYFSIYLGNLEVYISVPHGIFLLPEKYFFYFILLNFELIFVCLKMSLVFIFEDCLSFMVADIFFQHFEKIILLSSGFDFFFGEISY